MDLVEPRSARGAAPLYAELLGEAGFSSVDVHMLEHDPFNAYFLVRP